VTTDKTLSDEAERLLRKNPRVDMQQLEAVLKAVQAVCGDRKPSEPKGSPYPFGRAPKRLRTK